MASTLTIDGNDANNEEWRAHTIARLEAERREDREDVRRQVGQFWDQVVQDHLSSQHDHQWVTTGGNGRVEVWDGAFKEVWDASFPYHLKIYSERGNNPAKTRCGSNISDALPVPNHRPDGAIVCDECQSFVNGVVENLRMIRYWIRYFGLVRVHRPIRSSWGDLSPYILTAGALAAIVAAVVAILSE